MAELSFPSRAISAFDHALSSRCRLTCRSTGELRCSLAPKNSASVMSSVAAIRSREPMDGDACPFSTCEMKLGENPAEAASVRTESFRDSRTSRTFSPTCIAFETATIATLRFNPTGSADAGQDGPAARWVGCSALLRRQYNVLHLRERNEYRGLPRQFRDRRFAVSCRPAGTGQSIVEILRSYPDPIGLRRQERDPHGGIQERELESYFVVAS